MKRRVGLVVLLACSACALEEEPGTSIDGSEATGPQVVHVTASTVAELAPSQQLLVDLTQALVFVFDPSHGALDYGRMDLVCPNGAGMRLDGWMTERSIEIGADITLNGWATLSLGPMSLQSLIVEQGPSDSDCYLCTDGAWMCFPEGSSPASGGASGPGESQAAGFLLQSGGYVGPAPH